MQTSLEGQDLVCPVCQSDADLLDVVDFNTTCEQARGRHFALSGIPIYYAQCPACGFAFAPQMRGWTSQQWRERVYNADYALVDPDHERKRPLANAAQLIQVLGEAGQHLSHLDYGGGNGLLAATLRSHGWHSTTWDAMDPRSALVETLGTFDLITAFEVAEHVPDPQALMAHWRTLLKPSGLVLLSTLLNDGHLAPNQRLTWWYAAPRNGHVSLFSARSLQRLAQQHGWVCTHLSPSLHALHVTVPAWAASWLPTPPQS